MMNIHDVVLQLDSESSLCPYFKLPLLLSDFNEIICP